MSKHTKGGKPGTHYSNNLDYHAEWSLLRKYDLTLAQYDLICEQQGGVCAICGGVNKSGRRLAVDHDHDTGNVRALLCTTCNVRIGVLENEAWVRAGQEYLLKHKI